MPTHSLQRLKLGPMENFIYLIHDTASNRCAVVDPAWDATAIQQAAADKGWQISDILLTHSHHDHVNALEPLLNHCDAAVHLLRAEAKFWDNPALLRPQLHSGGDRLLLGDTAIDILHTPGHTPGSACYWVAGQLISGDTLFIFGCGRCDLPGGDAEQLFGSLKRLRQELPADTEICPGHDYAHCQHSTMAEQIQGNPFLHPTKKEDFVHYRMHGHRGRAMPYRPISPQEFLASQK